MYKYRSYSQIHKSETCFDIAYTQLKLRVQFTYTKKQEIKKFIA